MSLNTKEIDLILDELDLEGRFVQKIVQPSYTAIVLYLYREKPLCLFISLEAGGCRLHSTEKKIPKWRKNRAGRTDKGRQNRQADLSNGRLCVSFVYTALEWSGEYHINRREQHHRRCLLPQTEKK